MRLPGLITWALLVLPSLDLPVPNGLVLGAEPAMAITPLVVGLARFIVRSKLASVVCVGGAIVIF